LIDGEITHLILFGADPLRDCPDTPAWEEALTAADFVVSFSMHENATTAKADVVLPLETHAEKDGTVTHPDGRLQRVRPSASRPEDVLPNIIVLSELAAKLGLDTGIDSQPTAFKALTEAVSFYNGIEDTDIGGRGVRWQETTAAANAPTLDLTQILNVSLRDTSTPAREDGLALGTYRDLWAGPITELNPPLKFLTPHQRLEISPHDAERLDLKNGEAIRVSQNGSSIDAAVLIKERIAPGTVFMAEGVVGANANALLNGGPVQVKIEKLREVGA